MLKISQPYTVICEHCGYATAFTFDLKCISTYNRNMGMELEYEAIYEDDCSRCGSELTVILRAWEYPEGTLNDVYLTLNGCNSHDKPMVEIKF